MASFASLNRWMSIVLMVSILAGISHLFTTSDIVAATSSRANTLTLVSAEQTIATHDGQTLITATLSDGDGQPVSGAIVQFASTLGSMSSPHVTTDQAGQAQAIFLAGPLPGPAEITVRYEDLAQAMMVGLETAQVSRLALQLGADQLLIEQSFIITVTVHDQFGRPAVGEVISLFGSLGTVARASGLSNEAGQFVTTFSVGTTPGEGRISALAGYEPQTVAFHIDNSIIFKDHLIYLPLIVR